MKYDTKLSCYTGISSLEDVATKNDKVVVMNILGNESKKVTPVSHAFSGGNVVAGVQYGRPGKIETPIGDIPVYSRLAEVVKNHKFNTGVIYLPPQAVFYAVSELCHYKSNKEVDLKKIVIVTEKLSVKDQRLIRAICQRNEIDVFGANSLGIGDSWNKVRIGGALGGDSPEESLVKGSVAIHSNSGNFGNTIAEYIKTEGFGTTTIISSGKDIIIQFAAPEFLNAAENDHRTNLAVMYVEPGGFYEKDAIDAITSGEIKFTKPIVACVTGRWKSNLTRAVGHAGALAGSGDDAEAKEKWFDDYFGVPVFNPDSPENVSEKGVRVSSIQHIPAAIRAIYKLKNKKTDFEPIGDLSLKLWMGNDFDYELPEKLRLEVTKAISPYNEQIIEFQKQVGATYLRQPMRNNSGASRINRNTQVAELHNSPIIDLINFPLESNLVFALIKSHPYKQELKYVNICLNILFRSDSVCRNVVEGAFKNNATPNQALIAGLSMLGDHPDFMLSRKYIQALTNLFTHEGIRDVKDKIDIEGMMRVAGDYIPKGEKSPDQMAKALSNLLLEDSNVPNISFFAAKYVLSEKLENPTVFLLSALLLSVNFKSLMHKRISRNTSENMFGYFSIVAQMINWMGVQKTEVNDYLEKISGNNDLGVLQTSFTQTAYVSVFGSIPDEGQLREFKALIALTLTNGPGTISAKGAKESVSARNNLSTAFSGFLANTGLAHGGNGYEAIQFLLDSFKNTEIADPGLFSDIPVNEISDTIAIDYKKYKEEAKQKGQNIYKRIPCINHPVFKGEKVNIDPREDFIYKLFKKEKIENVFWDFYHSLVESLYNAGVSKNVYCVNIDAVIAVISLKLMWNGYRAGKIGDQELQRIAFFIFLIGRMTGVSAEIVDHTDRGTDMDTRTPQRELGFVL